MLEFADGRNPLSFATRQNSTPITPGKQLSCFFIQSNFATPCVPSDELESSRALFWITVDHPVKQCSGVSGRPNVCPDQGPSARSYPEAMMVHDDVEEA